jgi:hypothetical protein
MSDATAVPFRQASGLFGCDLVISFAGQVTVVASSLDKPIWAPRPNRAKSLDAIIRPNINFTFLLTKRIWESIL